MNNEDIRIGKFFLINNWPDKVLEVLLPHIEVVKDLVPGWCEMVVVNWDSSLTQCNLVCSIEYDYRRFRMSVSPTFLDEDPISQRQALVHEMVHAFTLPLMKYSRKVITHLLKDNPNAELIIDELKERNESITQDLAHVFYNKAYK